MFKVGDWITIEGTLHNDKFQLTENEVKYKEILLGDFSFAEEKWKHWKPQEGEWCWYGYELVQVIDAYNLGNIKICRQNSSSYEEVKNIQLEPFIGELPSFIKD